jgi:uncharacterized protein YbjT (DUF2867 family)
MKVAVAGGTGLVGAYTVAALAAAGHDPVPLSRATGVDVRGGAGLADALGGVEAIIDALSTNDRAEAGEFHEQTTRNLQQAGAAAGARHVVTLSIVGIDRVSALEYYRAKLRQEQVAAAGPLPATIVRATQFHEFGAQMIGWTRKGAFAFVPHMPSQTVAARSVAQVLAEVAVGGPLAATLDVAGPDVADIVDRARAIVKARGRKIRVIALPYPGAAGKQVRAAGNLPGPGARIVGPAFADWLRSADAATPDF